MITYEELQRIGALIAQCKRDTDAHQADFKAWEERMRKRSRLKLKLKQEWKHVKSRFS